MQPVTVIRNCGPRNIRAARLQPASKLLPQDVIPFRMMIGKHLRAFIGKGAGKGFLELPGRQRIQPGDAGGEINQARFIGLPHEIDQPAGGLKMVRGVQDRFYDSRTRSRRNWNQMKIIPRQE